MAMLHGYLIVLLLLVWAYYPDSRSIIGSFTPGVVYQADDCKESNNNACLEVPTKEMCKKNLSTPTVPWLPLPWWYIYCQSLLSPKAVQKLKTTSSTVHEYFKNVLRDLTMYRKSQKANKIL
ncbi:hypothetical protein RR48_05227 [Papilio machaon]|uniref:Uncharacterized protein n=1 Tax=Papilio machaon TaxID=76193 RepID=A0A0N1I739_PAPMA|nr:hypothetical protein RR48_05227 [Papilio machaon]